MEFTGNSSSNLLRGKIAELEKTKADLKEAKEEAMQSWLDSRPLIDELERMQAGLVRAKEVVLKANITISELQAQLETANMCIKSAKEEEEKSHTMINDKNQALHKAQEEMEQLKVKRDQKRRMRSKLKLVLRLKRQSLQTLQLTCEAIQLESEAFTTSAAQALHHINNSEAENNNTMTVQLTQLEYDYLKKEASEQTSVAEWRILACSEEKLAAEKSRDSAFRRLHNLYPQSNVIGQIIHKETITKRNKYTGVQGLKHTQSTGVNKRTSQQHSGNNSRFLVKRKKSIFFRIKTFIVRNIAKYFN
ncbi:hypothetical protein ACS0TY_029412 [Phlomoides rotata]